MTADMPKVAQLTPDKREAMRAELTKIENAVLQAFSEVNSYDNVDRRWISIGRTDIQRGFMAVKRALDEGDQTQKGQGLSVT